MESTHQEKAFFLELPIKRPSVQFKGFVKDLGNPIQYDCFAQYINDKLWLSSSSMPKLKGGFGKQVSIEVNETNPQKISHFASKFNAANSISASARDIHMKISAFEDDIILQVTITVTTLSAQMALSNFFTLIDSNN